MSIPQDAVEAAKEAMREVTPPPGASKADWLAEYGGFALIAGAIAAAAPHIQAQALRDAADEQSRRSETLLKTMEGMVSAGYGSEDILRYGAYSAEAQTTAYRLRARADRLEGK